MLTVCAHNNLHEPFMTGMKFNDRTAYIIAAWYNKTAAKYDASAGWWYQDRVLIDHV